MSRQTTGARHVAVIAIFAALVQASCSRPAPPRHLTIAAASDLKFAMEELAVEFRRGHPGVDIRPTYGSSGNFYSQIRGGAPFDVFLSADVDYPRRLVKDGIGAAASLFVYGQGRIVIWVPAGSKLDPATALHDATLRHVAIANPAHAPYGRAAGAAMRSLGVYDALRGKLVLGENVAQAFEFVQSGAAEAGIVALSLALAPPARNQGRYWEIPLDAYPRIEQGGVILRDSGEAGAFRAFLLSAAARDVLKKYGFAAPEQR